MQQMYRSEAEEVIWISAGQYHRVVSCCVVLDLGRMGTVYTVVMAHVGAKVRKQLLVPSCPNRALAAPMTGSSCGRLIEARSRSNNISGFS